MKPSGPTVLPGKGVATLDLADEHYPAWLRTIPDPPPVLYCDGSMEPGDRQAVAIVGSRQATPYGLRVTDAPTSRGPHGLLKQGAKLVETVDDIVEELLPQLETMRTPLSQDSMVTGAGKRRSFAPKPPDLSSEEQVVLRVIGREPSHLD